jgi:hypothetical protein
MLDARAHLKNFIPQGSPVGKLTQLPFYRQSLVANASLSDQRPTTPTTNRAKSQQSPAD